MKKLIFTFALVILLMPGIVKAESTRFLLYSTTSGCNVNGINRCSTYEFYNYTLSNSNMDFFRINGNSPQSGFQDVFNLKFEKSWDSSKSYSLVFNLYSNELDRLQDVTVNSMACIFSSPKYEDYHDGDYPFRSYITSVYCPIVAGKQGNDEMFQVRAWFTSSDTFGNHYFGVSYHVAYEELDSSSNQDILDSIQSSQDKIIDNQDKNHQDTMDTITNGDVSGAESTGSGFFESFENNDHGLSGIVSSPLRLIKSFSSSKKCYPLPLTMMNKTVYLPCSSYVTDMKGFDYFYYIYNLIVGGLIAYGCCKGFFKEVENLKNPDDSRVEVMDL
ncbi:MAG: hypothetical protein K2G03_01465 [Bacilli bacterium]|nr:hypothetical protein [Bacilli bacterium]